MTTDDNRAPISTPTLILACPHGFCAGVSRAIATAEEALRRYPGPVYCLNEIVHNQLAVGDLQSRGMIFVKQIEDVPEGGLSLFSAHGVTPSVRQIAEARHLHIIDATCPFVTKVHREVVRYAANGYTILLIGHPEHEEIVGVKGEAPDHVIVIEDRAAARRVEIPDPSRVAAMTQTTLSVKDTKQVMEILEERFPLIEKPPSSDICYATQNRQRAVRELAARSDLVVVLGARNSSNTNRLVEVARDAGTDALLLSSHSDLDQVPGDTPVVGITAGASTPEHFVQDTVAALKTRDGRELQVIEVVRENTHLPLPRDLR